MLKEKFGRIPSSNCCSASISRIGSECGNVSKYYGDIFTVSVNYEYTLDIAKDLTFVIFIGGTAYGSSGVITKSGSGTDNTTFDSLPISLPPGTYDVEVRLYMGDVGSGTGGLVDIYTCTGALTVLSVTSADITDVSIT